MLAEAQVEDISAHRKLPLELRRDFVHNALVPFHQRAILLVPKSIERRLVTEYALQALCLGSQLRLVLRLERCHCRLHTTSTFANVSWLVRSKLA